MFAVTLPLKLFRATVTYADIGSLKSLHIFLKECLYHIPMKFEQTCMVQTTRNFELFAKKKKKKKKKTSGRRSCGLNYSLMLNY